MSTPRAYATRRIPAATSDFSDGERALCRLRRLVISSGWRSLNAWVEAQDDPAIRYSIVRMTIERWAHRDQLPNGAAGRLIARRLRSDFRDDLCPVWPAACRDDLA